MSKQYDATKVGQQAVVLGGVHTSAGLLNRYSNSGFGAPVPAGSTAFASDLGPTMFNGVSWQPITGLVLTADSVGAVGDGVTDDSTALQTLAALASSTGLNVQLGPKTYKVTRTIFIDGHDGQTFTSPNWYGMGSQVTIIKGVGFTGPIFKVRGGSGGPAAAGVFDVQFTGDANMTGLMISGKNFFWAYRCDFEGPLGVGIELTNADAGSFTEFCGADECIFNGLTTAVKFTKGLGGISFNGSGLKNRCNIVQSSGVAISIGSGCKVYNSPLEVYWRANGTMTLIRNSSAGQPISFFGHVSGERGSGTPTIADTANVYFAGDYTFSGEFFVAGTMNRGQNIQVNSDGSVLPLDVTGSWITACVTGANNIGTTARSQALLVYVRFVASGYDYRYALVVDNDGGGSAGYVTTLATLKTLNTAAYGAPTFSVGTNGILIATNASFPASGVTCYSHSVQFGPGNVTAFMAQT
jgi:hypothetical protein